MTVFAGHGLLSVGTQAVNAATGIAIIRMLPKESYARYILCVSIMSAVGILAEAGSHSTLTRALGKLGTTSADALAVIRYANLFRFRTTVASNVVTLPVAGWLLSRTGANLPSILLFTGIIAVGSVALATAQLRAAVWRIDYRYVEVGSRQLTCALFRLGSAASAVLIPDPLLAFWLIGTFGLSAILEAYFLRVRPSTSTPTPEEATLGQLTRVEFRRNALRLTPNSVFFLIQGQFVIWVLASEGSSSLLAELSALSRFAVLFVLPASILSNFIQPVVARQTRPRKVLAAGCCAAGGYVLFAAGVLLAMAWIPGFFLSILGTGYAGLSAELLILNCGAAAAGLVTILSGVSLGRAWLKWAWLYVPVTATWLAFLTFVIGFDSPRDAILVTALAPLTGFVSEGVMIWTGYRRDFVGLSGGVSVR